MLEVLINDKMKRGLIVLSFLCAGILIYLGVTELKSAIIRGTGNIDSIQVYKSKRKLMFFRNGDVSGEFRISLGFHPKGKKRYEKDGKTPEGLYEIDGKNAKSVAHKNLGISYPYSSRGVCPNCGSKDPNGSEAKANRTILIIGIIIVVLSQVLK